MLIIMLGIIKCFHKGIMNQYAFIQAIIVYQEGFDAVVRQRHDAAVGVNLSSRLTSLDRAEWTACEIYLFCALKSYSFMLFFSLSPHYLALSKNIICISDVRLDGIIRLSSKKGVKYYYKTKWSESSFARTFSEQIPTFFYPPRGLQTRQGRRFHIYVLCSPLECCPSLKPAV